MLAVRAILFGVYHSVFLLKPKVPFSLNSCLLFVLETFLLNACRMPFSISNGNYKVLASLESLHLVLCLILSGNKVLRYFYN